jgi:hypothetical protein
MVTSCVDLGRSSHVLSGRRFASFPRDRIRDVSHTVGGTAGAWGRSKLLGSGPAERYRLRVYARGLWPYRAEVLIFGAGCGDTRQGRQT